MTTILLIIFLRSIIINGLHLNGYTTMYIPYPTIYIATSNIQQHTLKYKLTKWVNTKSTKFKSLKAMILTGFYFLAKKYCSYI